MGSRVAPATGMMQSSICSKRVRVRVRVGVRVRVRVRVGVGVGVRVTSGRRLPTGLGLGFAATYLWPPAAQLVGSASRLAPCLDGQRLRIGDFGRGWCPGHSQSQRAAL